MKLCILVSVFIYGDGRRVVSTAQEGSRHTVNAVDALAIDEHAGAFRDVEVDVSVSPSSVSEALRPSETELSPVTSQSGHDVSASAAAPEAPHLPQWELTHWSSGVAHLAALEGLLLFLVLGTCLCAPTGHCSKRRWQPGRWPRDVEPTSDSEEDDPLAVASDVLRTILQEDAVILTPGMRDDLRQVLQAMENVGGKLQERRLTATQTLLVADEASPKSTTEVSDAESDAIHVHQAQLSDDKDTVNTRNNDAEIKTPNSRTLGVRFVSNAETLRTGNSRPHASDDIED